MPAATIRFSQETRDAATPLLEDMGISLSAYINMALRQLIIQKRVPFQLVSEAYSSPRIRDWGSIPRIQKVEGGYKAPDGRFDDDED